MFESYLCPNVECEYNKKMNANDSCPQCNAIAEKFGRQEGDKHLRLKQIYQKGDKALLATAEMSDSDIQNAIYRDMANLAAHEAGTAWSHWGTILSMRPADQITSAGFKMLVDQNKIIIRQNELILRRLEEMCER